uniref:Uncharacterized protein n=1 Tax=Oryza sativa subsp. japonica TaxID=39947 RepID=Q69SR9_ORYSJ|nr:hypothetical protein [Oryza sativa Japonica Group]BAD35966.1 hypothetical protein [Oryza sativa Japonica Group]
MPPADAAQAAAAGDASRRHRASRLRRGRLPPTPRKPPGTPLATAAPAASAGDDSRHRFPSASRRGRRRRGSAWYPDYGCLHCGKGVLGPSFEAKAMGPIACIVNTLRAASCSTDSKT